MILCFKWIVLFAQWASVCVVITVQSISLIVTTATTIRNIEI